MLYWTYYRHSNYLWVDRRQIAWMVGTIRCWFSTPPERVLSALDGRGAKDQGQIGDCPGMTVDFALAHHALNRNLTASHCGNHCLGLFEA